MVVRQTSLEAYVHLQNNNLLCANERIVLDVFEDYKTGLCNDEAAQLLGWEINRVTGRVNSLVKKGKLFRLGEKINIRTGRRSIVWACTKDFPFLAHLNITSEMDLGVSGSAVSTLHSSYVEPELYDNNSCEVERQ